MPRGDTVTSVMHADFLKNHLRPDIKSQRRGSLGVGVLLKHDNARPHTARSTVATIQDLSLECFTHPPYTPDLPPHPPMTFSSFDRSKKRWVTSLSGPTKRCSRRCTSGSALSQKNFLLELSMHFEALEHLYGTQWRLYRHTVRAQ